MLCFNTHTFLGRSTYDSSRKGELAFFDITQRHSKLRQEMDFACVETQIGDGSIGDCEIIELADKDVVRLRLTTT